MYPQKFIQNENMVCQHCGFVTDPPHNAATCPNKKAGRAIDKAVGGLAGFCTSHSVVGAGIGCEAADAVYDAVTKTPAQKQHERKNEKATKEKKKAAVAEEEKKSKRRKTNSSV
jgi:hypothetical protein